MDATCWLCAPHFLLGAQNQQLSVRARSTSLWPYRNCLWRLSRDGKSDGRPFHTPQQPLLNHPSGHLGGWAMPWSAEEMLDGQHQRVGVPMPGLLTVASSRKVWKWTSAESSLMLPRSTRSLGGPNRIVVFECGRYAKYRYSELERQESLTVHVVIYHASYFRVSLPPHGYPASSVAEHTTRHTLVMKRELVLAPVIGESDPTHTHTHTHEKITTTTTKKGGKGGGREIKKKKSLLFFSSTDGGDRKYLSFCITFSWSSI